MDVLLERFIVMYPASAQQFFITPERAKVWMAQWADDFLEEGITPDDIKRGLEGCKNHPSNFMPSLPMFLSYCKPPVIPIMHQSFPKIGHRLTEEERKSGLQRLKIAKEQLSTKGVTDKLSTKGENK
jgi:hypothetical protein